MVIFRGLQGHWSVARFLSFNLQQMLLTADGQSRDLVKRLFLTSS